MKTGVITARALGGAPRRTASYALSFSLGILPGMPKYRVYLRWPPQRVTDSTTTEIREVAEFAFNHLKARTDLRGQDVAVAMTLEGKQQDYFDFRSPGESSAESSPTPRTR